MAKLRCEVLESDGRVARVVRDEGGRVLRLHADAPPPGAFWLGTIEGAGVWAEGVTGIAVPDGPLEVVWLDTSAFDEVGVVVGPDRGDALGLFDSPTTASTGEHTSEGAGSGPDRVVGDQRRTAVLAWIAAQAADAPVPAEGGAPCEPLKRLVADEPLDPLPALDGVPRARPAEPRRELPAEHELGPEREDTATQIEGFEAMVERRSEAEPSVSESVRSAAPASAPETTPVEPAEPAPRTVSPLLLLLVGLGVAIAAWVLRTL